MEGLHHFNVEWPSFTTQPSVGKPRHTTACGTRYTICADQTSPAGLPCGDRIVTSTWLVLAVIVAVCSHSFWFCDRSLLALGQTTHGTPQLRPAVSFLTPPHRRQVFVRDPLVGVPTDRQSQPRHVEVVVSVFLAPCGALPSHHVEVVISLFPSFRRCRHTVRVYDSAPLSTLRATARPKLFRSPAISWRSRSRQNDNPQDGDLSA